MNSREIATETTKRTSQGLFTVVVLFEVWSVWRFGLLARGSLCELTSGYKWQCTNKKSKNNADNLQSGLEELNIQNQGLEAAETQGPELFGQFIY